MRRPRLVFPRGGGESGVSSYRRRADIETHGSSMSSASDGMTLPAVVLAVLAVAICTIAPAAPVFVFVVVGGGSDQAATQSTVPYTSRSAGDRGRVVVVAVRGDPE